MPRKNTKPHPKTRCVSFHHEGDIDVVAIEALLKKAQASGVIAQFDAMRSMERGHDMVWYEGRPGPKLRALRTAVASHVR